MEAFVDIDGTAIKLYVYTNCIASSTHNAHCCTRTSQCIPDDYDMWK